MAADNVRSYSAFVHHLEQNLDGDYKAVAWPSSNMPDSSSSKITFHLTYLIFIATIGPLLFGYHLVSLL